MKMNCIVPLAGPDLIMSDGSLRPLYPVQGEPLIKKAILSRPWYRSGELSNSNLIFILRATEKTPELADFLNQEFEGCKTIVLSTLTKGALYSALAGVSLIDNPDLPVCIDLADILFEMKPFVTDLFRSDLAIKGIIPYFISNNPKYSYLKIVDGFVKNTVEKQVISENASAGTYFYRNMMTFLRAAETTFKMDELLSYKGAQFLCPTFNALTVLDERVLPVEVEQVLSLSDVFHR